MNPSGRLNLRALAAAATLSYPCSLAPSGSAAARVAVASNPSGPRNTSSSVAATATTLSSPALHAAAAVALRLRCPQIASLGTRTSAVPAGSGDPFKMSPIYLWLLQSFKETNAEFKDAVNYYNNRVSVLNESKRSGSKLSDDFALSLEDAFGNARNLQSRKNEFRSVILQYHREYSAGKPQEAKEIVLQFFKEERVATKASIADLQDQIGHDLLQYKRNEIRLATGDDSLDPLSVHRTQGPVMIVNFTLLNTELAALRDAQRQLQAVAAQQARSEITDVPAGTP